MEAVPVEVIGNILSCLEAARDVIIASASCRKWREAARHHLHRLSFHHADSGVYTEMAAADLEVVITQTILRTTCLHELTICFNRHLFSAAPVVAWLMHTSETLRFLTYEVEGSPNVEVLERCGREKLQGLVLGHVSVCETNLGFHKFPRLRSLTLSDVNISALDLNLFLCLCPSLRSLSLVRTDIGVVGAEVESSLELSSGSVTCFHIEDLRRHQVVLNVDKLEVLSLKECAFENVKVVSEGKLRVLRLESVSSLELDVGASTQFLEVLDVTHATVVRSRLHDLISGAAKLRKLKLGGSPVDGDEEKLDLEAIAVSCLHLRELSLGYDHLDAPALSKHSSATFAKVGFLEFSSDHVDCDFAKWMEGIMERCPALTRLLVHARLSSQLFQDYLALGDFTTAMVCILRKYAHVSAEFRYS